MLSMSVQSPLHTFLFGCPFLDPQPTNSNVKWSYLNCCGGIVQGTIWQGLLDYVLKRVVSCDDVLTKFDIVWEGNELLDNRVEWQNRVA